MASYSIFQDALWLDMKLVVFGYMDIPVVLLFPFPKAAIYFVFVSTRDLNSGLLPSQKSLLLTKHQPSPDCFSEMGVSFCILTSP